MFRSTLIAAGAVVLCGASFAQQGLDPAKIHPVTVPVKDAGVFNWDTKQWVTGPNAGHKATDYTIYRNDCTWTGGSFFTSSEHCETLISQGTIPAPSTPGAPTGATVDNVVTNFQFAYCTGAATGGVDIKIGFYDNLGGDCAGFGAIGPQGGGWGKGTLSAPNPGGTAAPFQPALAPLGTANAFFDFGSASGNPLPGSTLNGKQGCWSIGFTFAQNSGFCLQSEGNGTWDNDQSADKFAWTFANGLPNSTYASTTISAGGHLTGPLLRGEPLKGTFGSGSYNIPPGSNGATGFCGTGQGTQFGGFWNNVDGSAPGVPNTITPNSGGAFGHCKAAASGGSGCYWFGAPPANPPAAFWMVFGSNGSCDGCSNRPENYCTAGTTSSGCNSIISAVGTSSASAATGFWLRTSGQEGAKDGLFIIGGNGRQANTWGSTSSLQCVVPPVRRTATQSFLVGGLANLAGTNGACDGGFDQDINARWTAKPAQAFPAGATVQAQAWHRDPGGPNPFTAFSNAIEWTVCP